MEFPTTYEMKDCKSYQTSFTSPSERHSELGVVVTESRIEEKFGVFICGDAFFSRWVRDSANLFEAQCHAFDVH